MLNSFSSVMKAKTKIGALLLSLLVSIAFVVAACGGGTATTQKTTVLSVAANSTGAWQQNFNPYSPTAFNQPGSHGMIYETLLFVNGLQAGTVTPWLASSYQFSTDVKTLTFHLRPNVQWSDGQPFTSADVVFTLNLLKQYPALDTNGLWNFLTAVTAPDSSTVVVTFQRPYSPILWYLGGQTWIVPKHLWSSVSNPVTYTDPNPVGTGPFTLKSFSSQLIDLGKNPRYWQPGKPQVTELRYPAFNTNTSAELQLDQGAVDWAGLYLPNVQQTYISRDPAHNQYWGPPDSLVTLFLNLTRYPFNLLPVRQAISLAIDRQQLNTVGESGLEPAASPTGLLLPAQQKYLAPAYATTSFAVDPGKANQLLQSAGFTKGSDGIYADKNGKKLTLNLNVVAGFTDWVTDAQIIDSELKAIGINVSVNQVSFGAYYNALQVGNFDAAMFWAPLGGAPLPFFIFDALFNSKNTAPLGKAAPSNFERWSNSATDSLLSQYASTIDPTVQMQAIQSLEKIMVEQLPAIPLLEAASFNEHSTAHFTGWPSASNPYANPNPSTTPDAEVVVLNLKPVG